jgi:hypothetical protein
MLGVHKRVGQIRKPDKKVTIDVIHAANRILEAEWNQATCVVHKKKVAEMGAWIIGGFCTGLRGEEMLLIELAGTANSLCNMNKAKNAHFQFVILGRTKGNKMSGAVFAIPRAPVTEGTHLRSGRWVNRLVELIHISGRRTGRLFSRRLRVSKMHEYANDFFTVLEKVQATTDLIPADLVIRDECGSLRIICCSLMAHARNMDISPDLINAVNRWKKEALSDTGSPRLDLADVYTSLKSILPTTLRYSLGL